MDFIIVIYCDNINNMLFANNSIYHIKTKHNEIHYHFVKNKDLIKEIDLVDVSIKNKVVDIFTKVLGMDKIRKFKSMFDVLNVDLSLKGNVGNSNSINYISLLIIGIKNSLIIFMVITFYLI